MSNDKIIIYQLLPRLYGNRNTTRKENGSIADNGCGKFNDLTTSVLKSIQQKGVSHIWFTGVIRHATKTDYTAHGIPANHPAIVKGNAGSPYAITDYYDVDPDLAEDVDNRMAEFEALVSRARKARLGIIIDFVPNHVARQYASLCKPKGVKDLGADDNRDHGFNPQNNFYYCPGCSFEPYLDLYAGTAEPYHEEPAKATGNDHFDNKPGQNDWYETVKLNYGVDYYAGGVGYFNPVPDTWFKMRDILLFWASKGIQGVRCDMAEMVPVEFWRWAIAEVRRQYPDYLFIGEVYNPALYRQYVEAGFTYLYDKVGMYDTLRDITAGGSATRITSAWQSTDDIANHMLYFLENHDEQRIASQFFAGDAFKAVPAFVVSTLFRSCPYMHYFAQEYGEKGMDKEGFSGCDGRTTIFDYWSVDTMCRADEGKLTDDEKALADIYSRIMNFARTDKTVSGQSYDLMYANPHSASFNPDRQYAFLRRSGRQLLVVVVNFDSLDRNIKLNIPEHAFEYLNLPDGKDIEGEDILTGASVAVRLSSQEPLSIIVPKNGAAILKFNKA
ncbi:MAG: alpha-amylase family glycosyl hydrolase [Prevotellaceae bacterium]|nr:alpha-amylase family glycosyl hydrolase [Prevotellaceae bacterium]